MFTQLNQTYISLIPKVLHPTTRGDYRPISLYNIAYKIISEVIANRLKPFLDRLISPYQLAFVKNRLISENIFVAHEIIHATRKKKKSKTDYLGLKIDMSKAFDRVEWDFLIAILMGFCDAWCNLIHQCISTSSSAILINEVPSKPFKPTRGLRQGDPLSPYLFILCMESFSRTLTNTESQGLISGLKINKHCPSITHLLFADDCLIFTKATTSQSSNLLKVLEDYGNSSVQMINFFKSGILVSPHISNSFGKSIIDILKVKKIKLDDKYLGAPLFTNKSKIA